MQNKLIRRELATFFLLPLVLPLIVILFFAVRWQDLYGTYILQDSLIPASLAVTLAVFMVIYLAYYQATCYLFRKNMGKA